MKDLTLKMRVSAEWLGHLDKWRRSLKPAPTRAATIRAAVDSLFGRTNRIAEFHSQLMAEDLYGRVKDAARYRWIIENCVEVSRDSDGEEISYFLHFDNTQKFEAVEDAIDRHIQAGSKENSA